MDNDINDFADEFGLDMGKLLFAIVKYITDDPRVIPAAVRHAMLTATDQEIDEALDAMRDDLISTKNKEAIL